jgi:hypothetical protein
MLKRGRLLAFALLATAATTGVGCGAGSDFKDEPRPPTPLQLSGVIRNDKVTVAPHRLGAGPVILIISNQTQQAHTVTVSGSGGSESTTVGPVNPLDTAKIQQNLRQGDYTVKAGSSKAVVRMIRPATLRVGRSRPDSSNQVMQP